MKKFKFVFLIFILFITTNVSASTMTYDRNSAENYGVNKNITITNSNKNNVLKTPLVNSDEKIYDFADILTPSEETEIYSYITEFRNKTGFDMVFVTIDSYFSSDNLNDTFASDFYDYNDFGLDIENYSGVLIYRNNNSSTRYFGLYSFGDAQLYYNTYRIDNILDEIESDFKHDYYEDGVYTVVSMLNEYYDDGIMSSYKNAYIDENGIIRFNYSIPFIPCLIASVVITFITMLIIVKKNKMIRKASKATEYLNKESISMLESRDEFINSHTSSYTIQSSSGSRGGSRIGSSGRGFSGGGRRG